MKLEKIVFFVNLFEFQRFYFDFPFFDPLVLLCVCLRHNFLLLFSLTEKSFFFVDLFGNFVIGDTVSKLKVVSSLIISNDVSIYSFVYCICRTICIRWMISSTSSLFVFLIDLFYFLVLHALT